jgi:hypothetical protein
MANERQEVIRGKLRRRDNRPILLEDIHQIRGIATRESTIPTFMAENYQGQPVQIDWTATNLINPQEFYTELHKRKYIVSEPRTEDESGEKKK